MIDMKFQKQYLIAATKEKGKWHPIIATQFSNKEIEFFKITL